MKNTTFKVIPLGISGNQEVKKYFHIDIVSFQSIFFWIYTIHIGIGAWTNFDFERFDFELI